jgi:glucose/arabinose dehydrogenase
MNDSVRCFSRLILFAAMSALAALSSAQTAPPIQLETVASGLTAPVGLTGAGDGSNRLFVVLQEGRIVIHDGVSILPTDFLNITALTSKGGERGLLGLAFHPNYESNRQFFVFYTDLTGNLVIARYTTLASDPNRASTPGVIVLSIPHPNHANHNGGMLAFGPDGHLYIATGDGGGSFDPENNAQNPSSLLGKILRLNVDSPGSSPQIWATGLRNPWRFSFDRATGHAFIGDVGQGTFEEIDLRPATETVAPNYGWDVMEGPACTDGTTTCNSSGLYTPPILHYGRGLGFSVTGGYRYRGARYPQLNGVYFYGDFGSGRIWGALPSGGGTWTTTEVLDTTLNISSFGEDDKGELYVVHLGGSIHRVVPAAGGAFHQGDLNQDGRSDVLWRHQGNGQNSVWLMNGQNIQSGQQLMPVGDLNWRLEGAADFNGDNRTDLLWRNYATGQNSIWFMNGTAVTQGVFIPPVGDLSWRIGGTMDFNLDGKPDILWRNYTTGENSIWLMDGIVRTGAVVLPAVGDTQWTIDATGDFNGDGMADIVWRHYGTGQNSIWLMRMTTLQAGLLLPPVGDPQWRMEGGGDFNNDGRTDLLWRHYGNGQDSIWYMNGTVLTNGVLIMPVGDLRWSMAGPK